MLEGLFQAGDRPEILAGPTGPWDDLREEFDQDADGIIWPREMPNRDFERFDRNRDGFVSLADYPAESGEIEAWAHHRLESRAAMAVLRKTLGIGDAAATGSWQEQFFAIDLNADRRLDRSELLVALGPQAAGRRDGISALLDLVDTDQDDQLGWTELDAFLVKASDDSR